MTNPCFVKKKLFPCINKSFFVLFVEDDTIIELLYKKALRKFV